MVSKNKNRMMKIKNSYLLNKCDFGLSPYSLVNQSSGLYKNTARLFKVREKENLKVSEAIERLRKIFEGK